MCASAYSSIRSRCNLFGSMCYGWSCKFALPTVRRIELNIYFLYILISAQVHHGLLYRQRIDTSLQTNLSRKVIFLFTLLFLWPFSCFVEKGAEP